MASILDQSSGSFGAVANATNTMQLANGYASMAVWGTFVGTIQLQARPAGITGAPFQALTATAPSGGAANITAPGIWTFEALPGDWEYQVACTAYTSGTINYAAQVASAGP